MSSIEKIKQLREETGVSIGECKQAIDEAKEDMEMAKEILRRRGKEISEKKSSRLINSGLISSYVHSNNRVGVLLKLSCESDFVAQSSEFKDLAHELNLQIAAMDPKYIQEEDIPEEIIEKEKDIYQEQLKDLDKPEEIKKGIIKGKLEKWKKEVVFLKQPWIKDGSKTIQNLIEDYVAKLGENIKAEAFNRYQI
jgi:elongation factor Ts